MKAIVLETRTLVGKGSRWGMSKVCVCEPRRNQNWGDELKFFALVGLTVLGPAIGYCVIIARLWPLYWMVCSLILGVVLGLVMYRKSSDVFLTCVAVTCEPIMPSGSSRIPLKSSAQLGPAPRGLAFS